MKVIRKDLPRVDALEKVTGSAKFVGDIVLPNTLHGKILRSPHAHAKILNIDTTEAKNVSGVHLVITGDDFNIRYAFLDTPRYPADEYPLAIDKVRYIGDEVAAVVAETEELAEYALGLIKVEYEKIAAVYEIEEAIKPESPSIHDDDVTNSSTFWEEWGATKREDSYQQEKKFNNASGHTSVEFGDVEKGFAEADYIREDQFKTAATAHCAMESHIALASYNRDTGNLDYWVSSQGLFYKRYTLSKILKIELSKLHLRSCFVGGAFGGKMDAFPNEILAGYASKKLGKPVKFELTREEVFTTTRQRHPVTIKIKSGFKKDGTIVAQDINLMVDNGAYRGSGPIVIFLFHAFTTPVYDIKNYKYNGWSVYTNNPIRGPQRGHGAPQIRYAVDSHLDMAASEMGLDIVEIMKKNIRKTGDVLPNGDVLGSCNLAECIKQAVQKMGLKEKKQDKKLDDANSRYKKGKGISLCTMFNGGMYYPFRSVGIVKVNDDGTVTLYSGTNEVGQGAPTAFCQIVAEELEIDFERVKVVYGDTEFCPEDMGSFLSLGAFVTGNAVLLAAKDAKEQLKKIAARLYNVTVEEIQYKDGYAFTKENNEKQKLSIQQLVVQNYLFNDNQKPVIGLGSFKGALGTHRYPSLAKAKGFFTSAYGFAAQVAEVEVDTWTGEVKLLKAGTFHDCGVPLNKSIVEGQVQGCVSMAQGQALTEEIILHEGLLYNASFLEYKLPSAKETPETFETAVDSYEPLGPFGAKEVGEGVVAGMIGAIANAVYDATEIRINSLPITREKILDQLKNKEKPVQIASF